MPHLPSLVDNWATGHWTIHLLTFFIVITDVNLSLVLRFSVCITRSVGNLLVYLKFHCKFLWLLIDNHGFPHKKRNSDDVFFATHYTLEHTNGAQLRVGVPQPCLGHRHQSYNLHRLKMHILASRGPFWSIQSILEQTLVF